ncbi:MAG: ABC transporter substrate-binding protein, partial [Thermotogae bacterium]
MRKFLVMFIIISAMLVTLATEKLVIYHWWTAGGERQAIDKLFELFKKAYPDIEIVENPIVGGGGTTLRTVLMGLLAAGMPPDTFQSLSGADLKNYVDGGYLTPVDDIWNEQNLDEN